MKRRGFFATFIAPIAFYLPFKAEAVKIPKPEIPKPEEDVFLYIVLFDEHGKECARKKLKRDAFVITEYCVTNRDQIDFAEHTADNTYFVHSFAIQDALQKTIFISKVKYAPVYISKGTTVHFEKGAIYLFN
jgi:hypothetical protein